MLKLAIPVLHVSSSPSAEKFYERLGFRTDFVYRPYDRLDPCYMGVTRDNVELHLSSFPGDGVTGNCVFLLVEDVDRIHRELLSSGISIDVGPLNQSWGNRELYIRDPDGNTLRFTMPLKENS